MLKINRKKLKQTIKYADILKQYDYNFKDICINVKLSDDFIDAFFFRLYPFKLEIYQQLSQFIIRKYQKNLNWILLIKNQKIPEDLLVKYSKYIRWKDIETYQNPTDEFIKLYKNYFVC